MGIFGARLRYLRERNELTGVELSKKLNVSKVAVSNWENGNRTPDIETIIKISNIFGCSVAYLLGVIDDPTSKVVSEQAFETYKVLEKLLKKYNLNSDDIDIVEFEKLIKMYAILKSK